MTGHGQGTAQADEAQVEVELRAVNNRFLKISVYSDLNAKRQSDIESLVKQHINRGTVSVRVNVHYQKNVQSYRLNKDLINAYWLELSEIAQGQQAVNVESVLRLPGVVDEDRGEDLTERIWPLVNQATTAALKQLTQMRTQEGGAMLSDMLANCQQITNDLESIRELAPQVIDAYSKKMVDRINGLLEKFEVSVTTSDVVKEVGVFAERCDISEEIVRLDNHIQHFHSVAQSPDSNGKKLEFLVQEMLRETNTIGSKANDSRIANHVVEIKTAIERIREMVQNVE